MNNDIETLKKDFTSALEAAETLESLEQVRVDFLGRKGRLAFAMKELANMDSDARREAGQKMNAIKNDLQKDFDAASGRIKEAESKKTLASEFVDMTIPGTPSPLGNLHLVTQAIEEISDIFKRLGFIRRRHPEIDWDWYAFESLNMPKNHPARDEWETFFMQDPGGASKTWEGKKGKVVLTPHTSNGQVREMEQHELPIRMININKTYRRQSDATHAPMFHQFEGLMIDKGISASHLKGVIEFFVKQYFGQDREIRLRPFHFRFVEPAFEIDITCPICKGVGEKDGKRCRVCKEGWHELGGAGMVHPRTLEAGNIDPEEYTGFAFGWGVERTMMMRADLNIDDIRILYKNDIRFLKQF
jgi:phenylalanyl-tRNA synthetase alpha chain